LTSKQLSGGGRWDDRFSMAVMFGAGLMTLALILWLIRTEKRKIIAQPAACSIRHHPSPDRKQISPGLARST